MQNIGSMLVVISLALTIVSAYLLIQIVGNITRRQEETARRVGSHYEAPPLPPNFY